MRPRGPTVGVARRRRWLRRPVVDADGRGAGRAAVRTSEGPRRRRRRRRSAAPEEVDAAWYAGSSSEPARIARRWRRVSTSSPIGSGPTRGAERRRADRSWAPTSPRRLVALEHRAQAPRLSVELTRGRRPRVSDSQPASRYARSSAHTRGERFQLADPEQNSVTEVGVDARATTRSRESESGTRPGWQYLTARRARARHERAPTSRRPRRDPGGRAGGARDSRAEHGVSRDRRGAGEHDARLVALQRAEDPTRPRWTRPHLLTSTASHLTRERQRQGQDSCAR